MFVFRFASLIDWPSNYKSGSFVIGVYGDKNVYDLLVKDHGNKTVGAQSLKVKLFNSSSEIERCHILYIDKSKAAEVKDLASKYKSQASLIVSDRAEGLKNGAMINFLFQNNRIQFEISKTNATKSKLVLNSQLAGYAVKVE